MTVDESQKKVIEIQRGYHLVLAPPGCGKTQILTERIRFANSKGILYENMLCLTFTNRAARGMVDRIKGCVLDDDVNKVFIGNIHRFCSRLLFDNNIIATDSSIIDEEDAVSIIARYIDEDENVIKESYGKKRYYADIIFLSHLVHQILYSHPRELRLHTDCLDKNDIYSLKELAKIESKDFDSDFIQDVYKLSEIHKTIVEESAIDLALKAVITETLYKFYLAYKYEKYKENNKLIDFEDLLITSYDALKSDKENKYKKYTWIQIDEVQDLNPLQLAIVDLITSKTDTMVMYLGDEQQAIFSFMGAKTDTLEMLRKRCQPNIHHLYINHRSPKYLLDLFNAYAEEVLYIDKALLPTTDNDTHPDINSLRLRSCSFFDAEVKEVAITAKILLEEDKTFKETTAIIVNANRDADFISEYLTELKMPHFKVSGEDLFSSDMVKLLLAHLNILNNEHQFISWARLFKGLKIFETNVYSRNFIQSLRDRGISPTDLLREDSSTYTADFIKHYEDKEIVVFDTETTGLKITEDDIVQIAAIKMRQGKVVENSYFNVFIKTEREIPDMLGDIPNPLIKEIKKHKLLPPTEALKAFIEYIGDATLLGHNAVYDYNILDYNLKRYLPEVELKTFCPICFDTLKLSRLLIPALKGYKLKHLLEELKLEGTNSHLADEDVHATVSLTIYCYNKAKEVQQSQKEFLEKDRVKECSKQFRKIYQAFYFEAISKLHDTINTEQYPALIAEMKRFYFYLIDIRYIKPILQIKYIAKYICKDIIDNNKYTTLYEQLAAYILEISTLKESDLCNSTVIRERIFVSTIHKAKGLEFDNVILFDITDGRFPNYYYRDSPTHCAEDARKLYVALTRAKKRIFVFYSSAKHNYRGEVIQQEVSPFIKSVQKYLG